MQYYFLYFDKNYLMQEKKSVRRLFVSQHFFNWAFNIKYKAIGYLLQECSKQKIIGPFQELFLLGRKFQSQQNIEKINLQIYHAFKNIIWITYRSGFPQLPNQLQNSYVSDTGWGCMIRVGQMVFAQIIKKHTKAQNNKEIEHILKQFSDFDTQATFSIQNIAKLTRQQYGLKPGQWYNPSQISFILNQLFKKKNPLGCQNLQFKIFNSGNLFFDQIAQIAAKKTIDCNCKITNELLCLNCNTTSKSVAIIILTRLGLEAPEPKYLSILSLFMQSYFFQGLIGGKPSKALYFVGKHKNQYIYLDPHYVQKAQQHFSSTVDSYFCDSFRKCKINSIDSSLGICFYLRSIQELNKFYIFMNKIKQQNSEDFFIFMSKETPSYVKQKHIEKSYEDEDQDYFQEL